MAPMASRAEALFPGVRDEAVASLRDGVSVSLSGLPGSGRSALTRDITRVLIEAGWDVIEIAGVDGLRGRPLEALAVAGLFDARATGSGTPLAAAVSAIRRAASSGRTAVVVDDADDLDEASTGALAAALRGGVAPVLSVVRIDRAIPGTTLTTAVRPAVRLAVPPLDFPDSTDLIERRCAGPVGVETAARIHAKSGGLPGLIVAITDAGLREGLLVERRGLWRAQGTLASGRLVPVLEPLVAGLDSAHFDALLTLALVGTVDTALARRIVAAPLLERLDDRGLLAFASQDGALVVSVYPPLLAEHLRRDRIGARRLRLLDEIDVSITGRLPDSRHQQLAPMLLGGEPRRSYLPQRGLGADPGDESGRRASADATLNRMVFERMTAETLVRKAKWESRRDVDSAILYALSLMASHGDPAEIEGVLSEAAAAGEDERALVALWRAIVRAAEPGGIDAARSFLAAETPRVGRWAPLLRVIGGHVSLVYDRVEPLPEPPEESAPALVAVSTRMLRAERALATGHPSVAREALAQIDEDDDLAIDASTTVFRTLVRVFSGDLDGAEEEARAHFDEGITRLDPDLITPHGYVLALIHTLRGDERALRAHLSTQLSVGYSSLRYAHFQLGALVTGARVAAGTGRGMSARSLAEQAERSAPALGPFPLMATVHARANARLVDGDAPADVAASFWETAQEAHSRGYLMNALFLGVRAQELHAHPRRVATMREWAAQAEPGGLVAVHLLYAQALSGDDVGAMREAAAELTRHGVHAASLRVQVAAMAVASRGQGEVAEEIARAVRAQAAALGGGYPALAATLLRGQVLTTREHEVARFAADGLSNPEIAERLSVSTRTVENHLYRVFQKLHISDRSALVDVLHGGPRA